MYLKKLMTFFIVLASIFSIGANSADKPSEILFERFTYVSELGKGPTFSFEIYKLNLDSGRLTKIADGRKPSVSPQGNLIAYQKDIESKHFWSNEELLYSGQTEIFVTDSEGKSHQNITNTHFVSEISPEIAPDGNLISYIGLGWGIPNKMCFINIDGTNSWCLNDVRTYYQLNCNLPNEEHNSDKCLEPYVIGFIGAIYINPTDHIWVPKQNDPTLKTLIVNSRNLSKESKYDIYAFTFKEEVLYSAKLIARGQYQAISPNGKTFFYRNNSSVYSANIDGTNHQKILGSEQSPYLYGSCMAVSPDSTKMAHCNYTHVYLANIDGTQNRPVFWRYGTDGKVIWMQNEKLLYSRYENHTDFSNLYVYDTLTTKSKRITFPPDDRLYFSGEDSNVVFLP